MPWEAEILRGLVEARAPATYVELGVRAQDTYRHVAPAADEAHGVDVDPACFPLVEGEGWCCSTREFFRQWKGSADVFFVDADHSFGEVSHDFRRSLARLNPRGVIALHDAISRGPEDRPMTGDVHELVRLLEARSGLAVQVLEPWPGLALIERV